MINIKDLLIYRNGKVILNDVSWQVKKGEHWAILGLNGSGKTTLAGALAKNLNFIFICQQ